MRTFPQPKAAAYALTCALAAMSAVPGTAAASSFQLMEQNASGLGNAYAGQAAAVENASTIFYNPAGMANLPGTQASGALSFIRPSIKFTDSGNSRSPVPALIPLGDNGGDAGDWAALPAGYLSWQAHSSLWLGLGFNAPFGLKTEYDANFMGRFQSQKADLKTYDVNPSIAWKINDTVTVGAGVSYQHVSFKLDRAAVTGVALPLVFTGNSHLDASDDQWGWDLGIMLNFGPGTRLGASYRSGMDYTLSGNVTVSGIPLVGSTSAPVQAHIKFPDTWTIGLAHSFNDQWEVLADVTYTRWSSIKTVPIVTTGPSLLAANGATVDTFNFQFDDTVRVGLGVNYRWTPAFTLKLGTAWDQSPVDDTYRLAALPDGDRTWLSAGGKYMLSAQAAVDFGYAHLFVDDASINQTKAGQGTLSGSYKNSVDILSAQFSYAF